MSEEKTRSHETTIEIALPPEAVWRGLTDASEIVRWFAPEAKVDPGVGGSIWKSWGGGMEGSSRIEVWEPGHHLRTVEERKHGPRCSEEGGAVVSENPAKPVRVVIDYYLEAKGGGTLLRLVHSGFGVTSDWDDEFESTRWGWAMYMRNLRHALTRHAGTPCRHATVVVPHRLTVQEAWDRVMGPSGFVSSGAVDGLREGDRLSWRTASGDTVTGVVTMAIPPTYFGGTLEQADDSLFGIMVIPHSAMVMFFFYGLTEEEAKAVETRWETLMRSAVAQTAGA